MICVCVKEKMHKVVSHWKGDVERMEDFTSGLPIESIRSPNPLNELPFWSTRFCLTYRFAAEMPLFARKLNERKSQN